MKLLRPLTDTPVPPVPDSYTNRSRNVGDIYYRYQSGVRLLCAGGAYSNKTNDSGPLAFSAYDPLTRTHEAIGSRSTRENRVRLHLIKERGELLCQLK